MQPIPASLSCKDQVISISSSGSSSDSPVDDTCCQKLSTWRQCCVRCPCLARCPLEISRHCSLEQPQHAAPASWEHRGHRRLSQDVTIRPQPRQQPRRQPRLVRLSKQPIAASSPASAQCLRRRHSLEWRRRVPRLLGACPASPAASQDSTQPRAAAGRVHCSAESELSSNISWSWPHLYSAPPPLPSPPPLSPSLLTPAAG